MIYAAIISSINLLKWYKIPDTDFRAILWDSPIFLLDEATVSLDIENELKVKKAIRNLLQENKTIVMIAHTLPIIRNADQIVVVANERIAEAGTHDELIRKQGKYYNMWKA